MYPHSNPALVMTPKIMIMSTYVIYDYDKLYEDIKLCTGIMCMYMHGFHISIFYIQHRWCPLDSFHLPASDLGWES